MIGTHISNLIFAAFTFGLSNQCVIVAQEHPPRAVVVITMSATDRAGRTQLKSQSDEPLKVGAGRKVIFYISANGSVGAYSDKPLRQTEGYRYAWDSDVKVISTDVDSVTFDLSWQRLDLLGGKSRLAVGDHHVITLRTEDRHVLDLVPLAPDAASANIVVEVHAFPLEDAAYAETKLSYELWLEHISANGEQTTRRVAVTGRQGERSLFRFDPIPLPLNVNGSPDMDNLFKMYLDGSIVGRITPDGTIQLSLQSRRSFKFGNQGSGWSGGTKKIITKSGEVISVELPPEGGNGIYRSEGLEIVVPKKGISIGDTGNIKVNFREFLSGAKTSIVVLAHRKS